MIFITGCFLIKNYFLFVSQLVPFVNVGILLFLVLKYKKSGCIETCTGRCLNCRGEFQQIGKYFNEFGHKILIDSCKKCGHTRER